MRLNYDDLVYLDSTLAGSVKEFTFFSTVKCNNEFLALINFRDTCHPGDGICKNMVRYNNVSIEDHHSYHEQETIDAAMALTNLTLESESRGRPRGTFWKME